MSTTEQLKQFLESTLSELKSSQLSEQKHKLLLQFYTKHKYLSEQPSEPLENDIWDYYTIGIYLYELIYAAK